MALVNDDPCWIVLRVAAGFAEVVAVNDLGQLRPGGSPRVPVGAVFLSPGAFCAAAGVGSLPLRLPVGEAKLLFGRLPLPPEVRGAVGSVFAKHPEGAGLLAAGWAAA